MDAVKEDMREVGLREEDTKEKVRLNLNSSPMASFCSYI